MSESETLYQVLHIKNGEEMFTYAEPYDDAKKTARQMQDSGLEVLSIMTQQGMTEYLNQKMRRAQGGLAKMDRAVEDFKEGGGRVFPVQEFQKAHRDVDAEVEDSLEVDDELSEDYLANISSPGNRLQAVDFALRLRAGMVVDPRTADELVADATTILKFLEG